MKPDICIYHGGCDDGFGAAYAVWKKFPNCQFWKGVYQSPPPKIDGLNIAIVDFSYKRDVMREIAAKACWVLVLDHHKTAQADLEGLSIECPNVHVEFDMERSGAVMAWEHFHPNTALPKFFEYLQDRDLWHKQMPGIDAFTVALRSYPQDFAEWDRLCSGYVTDIIAEGISIERYYRSIVDETKKHFYMRDIGGYRVPVVNASSFMASEVAGELSEGNFFAATYVENETHVIWSLRSRAPDGLDVSEIAKQFGGGGHKHAAGFKVART